MGFIDCKSPSSVRTCQGCRTWPGGVQEPRKVRLFKYQELAEATNNFDEKNILGKGSHSIVYKGLLNDGEVVAVKRPTLGRRTLQDAISFDNELDILSKLRHRHLVNLIGFCSEAREKLLVVEFMENGTLFDNLHHSGDSPLSWSARLDMALQAAKAIQALHTASPPIIHRDVKSSNILVDRNWNAKLSDLGLAIRGQLDDVTRQGNPPAGTMGYIDPEYQTPSQLSTKSDVFSFGILLLEIMSGRKAIDVRFNPSSLVDWAVPLIRKGNALSVCDTSIKPPQNVEIVQQLGAIAYRAVRQCKDRRPTMAEVVEGLKRVRKKLPSPLFGGNPPRVRRIAILKEDDISMSISREGPVRANSSPAAVPNDETLEDTSEWVSFSKSEDASCSGERTSSASDSEPSSNSYAFTRSWSAADEDSDGPVQVRLAKATSLGERPSKPESPIFDLSLICSPMRADFIRTLAGSPDSNSSLAMVGTPMRVDVIRNLAGSSSPNSPLFRLPRRPGDRMAFKKPLESPTFGSKKPAMTVDAWSSVASARIFTQVAASGASTRISTQGANSRFKTDEISARGGYISQSCELNNHSESDSDVQFASQSSFEDESISQVLPNRTKDSGGMQHPIYPIYRPRRENSVSTTRVSRVEGGSANRDSQVDLSGGGGQISKPKVSYRMDAVPIWGVRTPAVKFFINSESPFEKVVDLPIAV
ncbi:unnamed protein product [Calypogeia fissa]